MNFVMGLDVEMAIESDDDGKYDFEEDEDLDDEGGESDEEDF